MKRQVKRRKVKYIFSLIPFLLFCAFAGISFRLNFTPGTQVALTFRDFILEMIGILPMMLILIGLFDVWFPREKVEGHIGKESGIKGTLWIILLAILQAGPLYGAFPVAYLLWKKGSSSFNIFVYLGAFSVMKIPMLTFEVGFLGWKFSLLRTALTIPVFVLIAWIIERSFKEREFVMKNADKSF